MANEAVRGEHGGFQHSLGGAVRKSKFCFAGRVRVYAGVPRNRTVPHRLPSLILPSLIIDFNKERNQDLYEIYKFRLQIYNLYIFNFVRYTQGLCQSY